LWAQLHVLSKSEEATFAREAERKPVRSADSSGSKAGARGESTLKGLVIVAGAGSSNASGRASFVSVFFFWWKEERGVR